MGGISKEMFCGSFFYQNKIRLSIVRQLNLFHKSFMPASTRLIVFISFLLNVYQASSQKQYFKQYNIEQGLAQSQVTGISQDRNDNLWISTLGGISKFDGKTFTNYSETEGLCDNNTNCIYAEFKF